MGQNRPRTPANINTSSPHVFFFTIYRYCTIKVLDLIRLWLSTCNFFVDLRFVNTKVLRMVQYGRAILLCRR